MAAAYAVTRHAAIEEYSRTLPRRIYSGTAYMQSSRVGLVVRGKNTYHLSKLVGFYRSARIFKGHKSMNQESSFFPL